MKISIVSFCVLSVAATMSLAQGTWTQLVDMPEIRYGHTVSELNGKIYVTGGCNTEAGALPPTALVYDTASAQWSQIPLANNKGRWAHNSVVAGGRLYVVGGDHGTGSLPTMDMFDPDSGQWVSKTPMPTHRGLPATVFLEGKIYVIGGMQVQGRDFDYGGVTTVEAYDTSSGTWTRLADMPTRRWGHAAVAWNGKIYVFGGVSSNVAGAGVRSSVEVYDPQTNTWTTKSNMPTPRYSLTACLLDSTIYTIGGWKNSASGPIYDKVEVYNPRADTWRTETPLPVACALQASLVRNGRIYVYGGSRVNHPLVGTSAIYAFERALVSVGPQAPAVHSFALEQNYPNPFNPTTTIRYGVPHRSHVTVTVFNMLGQKVTELVNGDVEAGYKEVQFNASNLASGVYFYRLQAGGFTETKRLVIVK